MRNHKTSPLAAATLLTLGLLQFGCVTSGTHEKTVGELAQARADAADQDRKNKKEIADLKQDIENLNADLASRTKDRDLLQSKLDDASAVIGELQQRLGKLGQNVDQLTNERGQLAKGLNEAKERLEELRKQKAAAEARAATFRGLVQKLRSMIDAGTIKVTIRNGKMLIELPNDVLFDSGKTSLKNDGQTALAQVAGALASISDRRFLIAGHTDNVPIKTSRFPSNWELSTARAVEVTKLLIANGVPATQVAAAGYGEFDPVSSNDTPQGQAQNRRIEIILEPNLSDLPSLDNIQTE